MPFAKSIVNGHVLLDKLRHRNKLLFPSKYAESLTLKVPLESLSFQDLWIPGN